MIDKNYVPKELDIKIKCHILMTNAKLPEESYQPSDKLNKTSKISIKFVNYNKYTSQKVNNNQ